MSSIQRVLLCILGVFFAISSGDRNTIAKLNIKILYESLCPDSYNFILEQLHPSWDRIAKYVDIKLVPFGKSSSREDAKVFICQHGSAECRGNRIMSCGLSLMTNHTMKVKYVSCFMRVYYKNGKRNPEEFGKQCADGIDFDELMECYRTKQGTLHQLRAEMETNKFIGPQTNFIPTIIFNGIFDQDLQDQSLTNLYGTVCSILKETHPDACERRRMVGV